MLMLFKCCEVCPIYFLSHIFNLKIDLPLDFNLYWTLYCLNIKIIYNKLFQYQVQNSCNACDGNSKCKQLFKLKIPKNTFSNVLWCDVIADILRWSYFQFISCSKVGGLNPYRRDFLQSFFHDSDSVLVVY